MSDIATGLREMADWLDAHPEYAEQSSGGVRLDLWFSTKEQLATFARAAGTVAKQEMGSIFYLRKLFSGYVSIDANVPREVACRKIVTGTRDVPEKLVEAHTEEIVEWECEPILLSAEAVAS